MYGGVCGLSRWCNGGGITESTEMTEKYGNFSFYTLTQIAQIPQKVIFFDHGFDFVFLLLARHSPSELGLCSCFVRRFTDLHGSFYSHRRTLKTLKVEYR